MKPSASKISEVMKYLRSIPSAARSEQSRINGKRGGRPKGSKNRHPRARRAQ